MTDCRVLVYETGTPYPLPLDLKQPEENAGIEADYTPDLFCSGSLTLTSSTWELHPNNVLTDVTLSLPTFNDTTANVQLSGGTSGNVYYLVNSVTFSDGQSRRRTLKVPVEAVRIAA